MGHEREEVTSIGVGGYFGETALLRDEPLKVRTLLLRMVLLNRALLHSTMKRKLSKRKG